ncbi:hypothetical protein [Streptomyces sp. NBC_01481]|uniref:hypothetical protein n=1 Tax=Streptomyces sp. NBC_01481 TaxID=2975869 RepID=UPI00225C1A47|nr:hypothetical protein [Streptomyces sp. NBC_01481]MCX4582408.1 hypothetical protein [Streptomyces sp. NBC_01481]
MYEVGERHIDSRGNAEQDPEARISVRALDAVDRLVVRVDELAELLLRWGCGLYVASIIETAPRSIMTGGPKQALTC